MFDGFNSNLVLTIYSFFIECDLLTEASRDVIYGKRARGKDIAFLRFIYTKSWGYCICFWEVKVSFYFLLRSVYWKLLPNVFFWKNLFLILLVFATILVVSLGLYRVWCDPSFLLTIKGSLTLTYFIVKALAGSCSNLSLFYSSSYSKDWYLIIFAEPILRVRGVFSKVDL